MVPMTGSAQGDSRGRRGLRLLVFVGLLVGEAAACGARAVSPAAPGDAIEASDAGVRGSCDPGYQFIPGGDYLIGSDASDPAISPPEYPQWTAVLSAFCMKRTEVTVAEFRACRTSGRCLHDPDTTAQCNWNVGGRDNHPINCVEWSQAAEYCAWSGGRLPTEAEWEGAARGPTWRLYPWGATAPTNTLANMNSINGGTQEVALAGLDRCNSPFGLCDMAGNVWEWVNDWWGTYPTGRVSDPVGALSGPGRVDRGGGWVSIAAGVRASVRPQYEAIYRFNNLGFRCARAAR